MCNDPATEMDPAARLDAILPTARDAILKATMEEYLDSEENISEGKLDIWLMAKLETIHARYARAEKVWNG